MSDSLRAELAKGAFLVRFVGDDDRFYHVLAQTIANKLDPRRWFFQAFPCNAAGLVALHPKQGGVLLKEAFGSLVVGATEGRRRNWQKYTWYRARCGWTKYNKLFSEESKPSDSVKPEHLPLLPLQVVCPDQLQKPDLAEELARILLPLVQEPLSAPAVPSPPSSGPPPGRFHGPPVVAFGGLPEEVLLQVLQDLSQRDIDRFRQTCRELSRFVPAHATDLQPHLLRDMYMLLRGRPSQEVRNKIMAVVGYLDAHRQELQTIIAGDYRQASLADGTEDTNGDLLDVLSKMLKKKKLDAEEKQLIEQYQADLNGALKELERIGQEALRAAGIAGTYRRMHCKILIGTRGSGPQVVHMDGLEPGRFVMALYLDDGHSTSVFWDDGPQRRLVQRSSVEVEEMCDRYWPLPWPDPGDEQFVNYVVKSWDAMLFSKSLLHYGPRVTTDRRRTLFCVFVPEGVEVDNDEEQFSEASTANRLEDNNDVEPSERHVDALVRSVQYGSVFLQLDALNKGIDNPEGDAKYKKKVLEPYRSNLLQHVHDRLLQKQRDGSPAAYEYFMKEFGTAFREHCLGERVQKRKKTGGRR